MKEIGGYFGLELPRKTEFHQQAGRVNNGRNAFRYLLKANRPSKIFIPAYVCDSILEPLKKEKIAYEFYYIDSKFHIKYNIGLGNKEKILYVNYFGMKDDYVRKVVEDYGKNSVVIDNTQAFFSRSIDGVDAFYSARKFFGVADGAYVYANKKLEEDVPSSFSCDNYAHLLGRLDMDASSFYSAFQKNEERHSQMALGKMSSLTQRILSSIDYDEVAKIRKRNFNRLHKYLGRYNELAIPVNIHGVPMVYPFKSSIAALRDKLIQAKIYVARYWEEVLSRVEKTAFEYEMVEFCLPLPIDQRYSEYDMNKIIKIILAEEER
jgi:tRNA isopentenyl-2-thiomethyl-A-37 hydroxylase MiaE